MAEDGICVEILKRIDPGTYLVREIAGEVVSQSVRSFERLCEQMQEYYANYTPTQLHSIDFRPGTVYIAKYENKWVRVQCHSTMTTIAGYKVSCTLVDFGKDNIVIPITSMREALKEFLKVPFQAREVVLDGIQPQSLKTDIALTKMSYQPCHKWDSAAFTFVEKLTEDATNWQAFITGQDETGRSTVRLCGEQNGRRFCVNDLLVQNKYAAVVDGSQRGMLSTSHIQPVTDPESYDDNAEEHDAAETSKKQYSESTEQPPGVHSAAAVNSKLASAATQPESPNSESEVEHDDADSRQLNKLDAISFAPSARSLRGSSSQVSLGLAAARDLSGATDSEAATSPESTQSLPLVSPRAAMQVLKDSADALGTKPSVENQSSLVTTSSANVLPLSNVPSSRVSNAGLPLSTSSSPDRLSAHSPSGKNPGSPHSASSTLSEKSVGRGHKLLTLLKDPAASAEVGLSASLSLSEPTGAKSLSSNETHTTLHYRKEPPSMSMNLEQMPNRMVFSGGLDEDFDIYMESSAENGQPVVEQAVAEKRTSPKSTHHNTNLAVPENAVCNVAMNKTAVAENVADVHASSTATQPKQSASLSPVVPVGESIPVQSPGDQAIHATPVSQSQSKQVGRGHTPLSSESPGPLERSAGSSTDVSLCSDGLDQSSASKMLTKRLPKIASRSGSKTGTPMLPYSRKSVPSRSPPSGHSTPTGQSKSSQDVCGRNKNSGDKSEICHKPATDHTTVPSKNRSAGASETPVSSVPSPPAATSDHVRSNGALSTSGTDVKGAEARKQAKTVPVCTEFGVLLDGDKPFRPIDDLGEVPYAELISSCQSLQNIRGPSRLQKYAWPAIWQGSDVIGVCPSDKKHPQNSGKTTSYLLPLSFMLNNKDIYCSLPKYGLGAYMVVLCATWRTALNVYDLLCEIVQRYHSVRPLLMYGASGDREVEVKIANGCDVIITTPDCLLHTMNKRATDLFRLCHLVIEDADVVLDRFSSQIEAIMTQYKAVLTERAGMACPQQTLLFASRWTEQLRTFATDYISTPLFVIASPMDMSYYGQVRQVPVMCNASTKFDNLKSILNSQRKKRIVFTATDESAIELNKMLSCASFYTLLAHGCMLSSQLAAVYRQWNLPHQQDSMPVFVMSDTVLDLMEVKGAAAVVHYDIPNVKETFAKRLLTMQCFFFNHCILNRAADECVSHLLVPDSGGNVARKVVTVLERSDAVVDARLKRMCAAERKDLELRHGRPVCRSLKATGACQRFSGCPMRHNVYDSLDLCTSNPHQLQLPSEGSVKVQVVHVKDATCYMVRLMEHKATDGTVDSHWNIDAKKLLIAVDLYFANKQNVRSCESVNVGDLCAWEDAQHIFHRVKVEELIDKPYEPKAKVYFIDSGRKKAITRVELIALPERFASVPHQAVEVFICRVRPVDGDVEWTKKAGSYITDKIENKILEGNIAMSLGSTLFLDPLVLREWLPNIKEWSDSFNVRTLLLEQQYAVENPEHIEQLYEVCEGSSVRLPGLLHSSQCGPNHGCTYGGQLVYTRTERFPADGRPVEVKLSAIETPDIFYVQLSANLDSLKKLNEKVNQHVAMTERGRKFRPRLGMLVLARNPHEGVWNRAKVIDIIVDPDKVEVFFVDYGDVEYLSCDKLLPMPVVLRRMPFQAIECSCLDVEPLNVQWTEDDCDAFHNLFYDKNLLAQVYRTSPAQMSGQHRYGVRIISSLVEYDVDVASSFIALGHALLSTDKLEELYRLDGSNSETPEEQQMKLLCRSLLKKHNDDDADTVEDQVILCSQKLVIDVIERQLDRRGLIRLMCQTLEYCWHPNVAVCMLESLTSLVSDSEDHCKEICNPAEQYNYWNNLCHMLEVVKSAEVLNAMLQLVKSTAVCRSCSVIFAEFGGLRILCQRFIPADVDLTAMLPVMEVIFTVVCTILKSADVEEVDFENISDGVSDGFTYCALTALSYLNSDCEDFVDCCLSVLLWLVGTIPKRESMILKYDGLKVLCQLLDSSSEPSGTVVTDAVTLLKLLIDSPDITRQAVTQSDVLSSVDRLMKKCDDSDCVGRMLLEIKQRLTELLPPKILAASSGEIKDGQKLPAHEPVVNQPIPIEKQLEVRDRKCPNISWAQSRNSLLLTVDVKDAVDTADMLGWTDTTMFFRTVSMSVEYSFRIEMYEMIKFCYVNVKPSCVMIGVNKRVAGLWPRLMQGKSRPPWLTFDVEHSTLNSSDDESDSDIDNPLTLVTRHARKAVSVVSNKAEDGQGPDMRPSTDDSSSSDTESSDDDLAYDPAVLEDKEHGFHFSGF